MQETHENRLKRMRMRSWRRGIKEMDIIFGGFADAKLAGLDAAELDLFDELLAEHDQEIYPWFTGLAECPVKYLQILEKIRKAQKFH